MKKLFLTSCLAALFLILSIITATEDCQAAMEKSHQYGDVTMQHSTTSKSGPVIFRHWTHRDKYSCRLCHVDLEFAQTAGQTEILEEDNEAGRYCGACHNGKEAFAREQCNSCHIKDEATGKELERQAKKAFFTFQRSQPHSSSMYGNKIDWIAAEVKGSITIKDSLPKISSTKTNFVTNNRDEPRESTLPGLADIIFSHSKHVKWNGCGMCHPQPFALENGKTKMNMKEITELKFCGRCHGTVAFPINDCSLCHSKPVSM